MMRILGIGNALVDVMTLIDNDNILDFFSLPKGSMQLVDGEKSALIKAETTNFKRNLVSGGSAANTIHGLAMLGVNTGFIGSVGKDTTGDFFESDMRKAGVKTFLSRRNSVTGTAVALISPGSERTFATHLGAAVELESSDLDPEDFKNYDILYLEGYLIINKALVERTCRIAKNSNMKIALDLSSYNVVDAKLDDFREIIENYVPVASKPSNLFLTANSRTCTRVMPSPRPRMLSFSNLLNEYALRETFNAADFLVGVWAAAPKSGNNAAVFRKPLRLAVLCMVVIVIIGPKLVTHADLHDARGSGLGDRARIGFVEIYRRQAQVRVIGSVEGLPAELSLRPLRELEPFGERDVDGRAPRPIQNIAPGISVAEDAIGHDGEGSGAVPEVRRRVIQRAVREPVGPRGLR